MGVLYMINALNVANSILYKAFKEDIDITPMKLQKLIYITYKEYLKKTNRPLFSERFEAWRYGPVIASVYDAFRHNKANAIKKFYQEPSGDILVVDEETSHEFKTVLNDVWNKYKDFDGIRLSEMTHKRKTAWRKAVSLGNDFLSDDDIKGEEPFV
jgi:uncharacterized phage-associated protein